MRRAAGLMAAAMFLLAGCARGAGSGPAGFLATEQDTILFLSWTSTGSGALTGSLQAFGRSESGSTNADSSTIALTGVHHGGQVSLTVDAGLGAKATWTGELHGSTLVLQLPQSDGSIRPTAFHRAQVGDYNSAVTALRQRLDQQQRQEDQAQADAADQSRQDAAVDRANRALGDVLTDLTHTAANLSQADFGAALDQYAKAWTDEQAAFQKEQSDLNDPSVPCGTVAVDAGTVSVANGSVSVAKGSLQIAVSPVSSGITRVDQDVTAAASALNALQAAEAANPKARTPNGVWTKTDVDQRTTAATQQAATASTAIASAQAKGSKYDSDAKNLNDQASALAHTGRCK